MKATTIILFLLSFVFIQELKAQKVYLSEISLKAGINAAFSRYIPSPTPVYHPKWGLGYSFGTSTNLQLPWWGLYIQPGIFTLSEHYKYKGIGEHKYFPVLVDYAVDVRTFSLNSLLSLGKKIDLDKMTLRILAQAFLNYW